MLPQKGFCPVIAVKRLHGLEILGREDHRVAGFAAIVCCADDPAWVFCESRGDDLKILGGEVGQIREKDHKGFQIKALGPSRARSEGGCKPFGGLGHFTACDTTW